MKIIMTRTKDDDGKRVLKKFDDDIRLLVDAAAAGHDVPGGPYSDEVYKAARNVAKAYPKWALLRGLLTD
jgi:hypothetical protein